MSGQLTIGSGNNLINAGNLTLDVGGDITLDADGGDIKFEDAGTHWLNFGNAAGSSAVHIDTKVSDHDLKFRGNDGGSQITALTLDMSEGGTATFNNGVVVQGDLTVQGTTVTLNTATLDVEDKNITLNAGSGDTSGSADGAGITIQDAVDGSTDASLTWRASDDKFIFSHKLRMFNDLELPDNVKLVAGDGNDLKIYHDGSNSFINETGTGNLKILADNLLLQRADESQTYIQAITGGAVDLRHAGNVKLATTSSGISVTGNVALTGDIQKTGQITLDASTDIALDTDTGIILLKDGGTNKGRITTASDIISIVNSTQDGDIKFDGLDGSSSITALRLDMSAGGTAQFAHDIEMVDNGLLRMGAGGDLILTSDGTNGTIFTNNGTLTIDSAARIDLSADDNGEIRLFDGSSMYAQFKDDDDRLRIQTLIQDKDMMFVGNDGGSEVTALLLDMSEAGAATFNAGATFGGNITVTGTVDGRDIATDGTKLDGIAAGATNVTNNNQLTNGAGYTTYTSNQATNSGSNVTFGTVTINGSNDLTLNTGNWTGEKSGKIQRHGNHMYFQTHDSGNFLFRNQSGSENTTISAGGGIVTTGNVTAYSDIRLKKDVKTIENALDKVSKLRGVEYTRISNDEREIGVIAQEVKEVVPELVDIKDNSDSFGEGIADVHIMKYQNTVGLLIEAIKELKDELKEVKNELKELKGV